MKKIRNLLSSVLAIVLLTPIITAAQPTIYLVRHAEKVPEWLGRHLDSYHPLSEEGAATADRVAKYFESRSVDAIYSSETTRTLHTALPLWQSKKTSIQIAEACMDTSAIDVFLAELQDRFDSSKTVVLFSHSNIIPYLLIKAGLPEDCYGDMGIVKSEWTTWLLIEGYDHIWKFENRASGTKACSDFERIRF